MLEGQAAWAHASELDETIAGVPGVADERAIGVTAGPTAPEPDEVDVAPYMAEPESDVPSPPTALPAPPAVSSTVATSTSPQPSASFEGLDDNGLSIPPDTHGAVGPSHLMVTLNTEVRIQSRIGADLGTERLETFWTNRGLSITDAFDPRVVYDPYDDRWTVVAVAERRSADSSVLVGVSQTSDPTGLWNTYKVDADSADLLWADFPSVGFNKTWVVVNVNMFRNSDDSFAQGQLFVFDKADLYGGGTGLFTLITVTSGGSTNVPAVTYDENEPDVYVVRAWAASLGLLRLRKVTGPLGSEVLDSVSFPGAGTANAWASSPPDNFAPQLSSTVGIHVNDHRIQDVVFRNGSVWTTHNVYFPSTTPTRSSIQWWELDAATGLVNQRGLIDDPSGDDFYAFPSISVNAFDYVLIGYSTFSSSRYASAAYRFRRPLDPHGTLGTEVVFKEGEDEYRKTFSGTRVRWGDYSATVVDPVNDSDLWTIQTYADIDTLGGNAIDPDDDRWGTWWAQVAVATPVPLPRTTALSLAALLLILSVVRRRRRHIVAVIVLGPGLASAQPISLENRIVSDDLAGGDRFGTVVDVDGDTAVVGAFTRDQPVFAAGAAYVFVRVDGVWTQQQKLTASDAAMSDNFGLAVAIDGDTIVVGAPEEGAVGTGAAYVFVRSGATWTEEQKLAPTPGGTNDDFGQSVGVSGDSIVVGAPGADHSSLTDPGAAFVFVRSGATWTQEQRLIASNADAGDRFGQSVAIDDDTVVAGAFAVSTLGNDTGAAYAFLRTTSTWAEEQILERADPQINDRFGWSVDVDQDLAIVGAYFEDEGGSNAGAAYAFSRMGTEWTQQNKLLAGDAADNLWFGFDVAVDGDRFAVGSQTSGITNGSAYRFRNGPGSWREVTPAVVPTNAYMVYDEARGETVAFTRSGAETWTFDGTAWTQESPTTSPPASSLAAIAYDSAREVVVLVLNSSSSLETWEWDGTVWTDVTPAAGSPPGRGGFAMTYDEARGEIVFFSGFFNVYLDDTWTWDGTTWTAVTPASGNPTGRLGHTMAYDAPRARVVLFGGGSASGNLDDTWEWDGTGWSDKSPTMGPAARQFAGMAYDPVLGEVLLFGGDGVSGELADLWAWNGTSWVERTPSVGGPSARANFGLTYDSGRGKAVLFGGFLPVVQEDTWEWSSVTAVQEQKVIGDRDDPIDGMGSSVALAETTGGDSLLLVGAPSESTPGATAGAVYAFGPGAPPPAVVTVTPGATSGQAPGPEPEFATNESLSGSGSSTVFIGGAGRGRSGVYKEDGGTTAIIADANTAVPSGTGTFDTTFIDVDTEGDDTIFSCDLGVFAIENSGALFRIADAATPIPGGGGATFDTFGEVEVSDGDFFFQGGSGGITGIFRDRARTLIAVLDATTTLPTSGISPTGFLELASGQGEIAFTVTTATGPGVYKADSATTPVLTFIADTTSTVPGFGTLFTDFEEVSIRSGDVAFVGIGSAGIFRGDGVTPLRRVVDSNDTIPTSPPEQFDAFDLIGDLDNGEVAFVGIDATGNVEGIFRATDTSPTISTLFDITAALPGSTISADQFGETAVNGDIVLFVGESVDGTYLGVYEVSVTQAATAKPITDITGALVWRSLGTPISLEGRVAFFGETSQNIRALYQLDDQGSPEVLVDNGPNLPGFLAFVDFPSYAAQGTDLLFAGLDEDGDYGIYSASAPQTLTVEVAAGLSLPGGGTLGVPSAPAVADSESNAIFANPSTGIYEAAVTTPTVLVDDQTADPSGTGFLGPDFVPLASRGRASAFLADDSSGNPTLYLQEGTQAPRVVANDTTPDPNGAATLDGFGPGMSVGVSGTDVAFVADDSDGQPTVYLWSGNAVSSLVQVGDAIQGGTAIGDLSSARVDYDNGQLVFTAEDDTGTNGLYLVSGGVVTVLADELSADPTFQSFGEVALDTNVVVFTATDQGIRDVYSVDLAPPPSAPLVPGLGAGGAAFMASLLALLLLLSTGSGCFIQKSRSNG